jgi:hypothetical protein
MIAESLAAFALVKGAVDAVKSAVDTANDVQGISAGLDALFHHRDAAAKELKKKQKTSKPKSKLHSFFSKKTGEDEEDELSVGAVAAMVLEQKKIDRDILNLGIRIDNKFGPGTWDEILATRDKMLEDRAAKQRDEKKAAAAQALKEDKFWDTILYWVVEASKLSAVLVVAGGIIYWVWSSRCTEGTC